VYVGFDQIRIAILAELKLNETIAALRVAVNTPARD
jgi:hypothetical protein